MKHLKKLSQIFEKQCYMLQDIHTNTASFSFGTTEGEFTLCFGKDKHHNPEYIIQSLRNGDASKKAADKFIVTHILAKPNNQMLYSEMVYTTAEQLPDIVEEKITPHIKDALM